MVEPRRMSTRYRGEPPPKKRALTPSPPPRESPHSKLTAASKSASKSSGGKSSSKAYPTTAPAPPSSEPEVEEDLDEELPVKLGAGAALPLLKTPQERPLPDLQWQSIQDSSVLSTSIDRSRQKWASEGIFERFWVKPSKKKPVTDSKQPAKESMSKLGNCTMIIEPHTFDITLYTVKDLSMNYQYPGFPPPAKPAPQQQQPTCAPGSQSQAPRPPPPSASPPSQAFSFQASNPPPQVTPAVRVPLPPQNQPHPTLVQQNPPPARAHPNPTPQPAPVAPQVKKEEKPVERRSKEAAPPAAPPAAAPTAAPAAPPPDPVIQMLAARAAEDPALKSLMKIVAAGNATPEQLKEFQSHIDELNAMIRSPRPASGPPAPYQRGGSELQFQTRPPSVPGPPQYQLPATQPGIAPRYYTSASSPYSPAMPKGKGPGSRTDIVSIVFDFGGNGDRFSFPRLSILDYLPGGMQVIVSFLVIRKGNQVASKRYKDSKTYYQPVTMRLSSHSPRMLESLVRVVAPPEEVRKYMDDTFDKMLPAESVYLPLRLPRSADGRQGDAKPDVQAPRSGVSVPSTMQKSNIFGPPSVMSPIAA